MPLSRLICRKAKRHAPCSLQMHIYASMYALSLLLWKTTTCMYMLPALSACACHISHASLSQNRTMAEAMLFQKLSHRGAVFFYRERLKLIVCLREMCMPSLPLYHLTAYIEGNGSACAHYSLLSLYYIWTNFPTNSSFLWEKREKRETLGGVITI